MLPFLMQLRFDHQFENFFPKDDEKLQFYEHFIGSYETDNDYLFVGIKNSTGIFNVPFLEQVHALSDSLAKVPRIVSVADPTELKTPVVGPFGLIEIPVLHLNQPELLSKDSVRIFESGEFVGSIFSDRGPAITIVLKLEPYLSKIKNDTILHRVEQVLQQFNFEELHYTGKIKGQYYFLERLQQEFMLFVGLSAMLLVLFLIVTFRAVWGVVIPVLVVTITAIWVLAIMAIFKQPLNMLTTLLPTIIFVVGVSDVVHIIEKYLEELRKGLPKEQALFIAFKEIGRATFLTSFTTAIGFLTLLSNNIQPIKDFGLFTAISVLVAYCLAFSLLPATLLLSKTPNIVNRKTAFGFGWTHTLHNGFLFTAKRFKLIITAFAFLGGLAIYGTSLVTIDNNFLNDWAPDESHLADFKFFEHYHSGVRPFEMELQSLDSTLKVTDYEFLQELNIADSLVKKVFNTSFTISELNYFKAINKAFSGGLPQHFRLGPTEKEHNKQYAKTKNYGKKQLDLFINKNRNLARLSAKIPEVGSFEMEKKYAEFTRLFNAHVNTNKVAFTFTGMGLLIDKNNEELSINMLYGLAVALLVVGLIMGYLYRSIKIVLIALIPNVLPLLFIAAIMGFFEIHLKITTAIVFTIAFGIAVDDTIHFMSKLKLELNKGYSISKALKNTYLTTGKAIIVTSIILVSGFMSLILSTIDPTFYVGLLISLTLLFALITDLTLLPALIFAFFGKNKFK